MSYQNENFGMMDEGYFVPRSQILGWLNTLLDLNLTKIQQLGAGSVYCQIIDVIHPGNVAMNKVNWKARNDYQFISNLKILQNAFSKIDFLEAQVQKLAKAKYQDNLQFIQWMKRYYDKNCGDRGNNYNAQQKRGGVVPDFSFAEKNVIPKTYNANGLSVPNKSTTAILEKPKKKQQIPKQQIEPNRIKSPMITTTKKTQTKTFMTSSKKVQKSKPQSIQTYKARVKDLQIKLCMITQVVQSQDEPLLKIKLIEQILEVEQQQIKKQMEMPTNNQSQEMI